MHKTEFFTNKGLYVYVIMPFALCNAPANFRRVLNLTFADFINKIAIIYLDDILVYSETH